MIVTSLIVFLVLCTTRSTANLTESNSTRCHNAVGQHFAIGDSFPHCYRNVVLKCVCNSTNAYCNDVKVYNQQDTQKCQFPFTYNGQKHCQCLEDGGLLWCSTTDNYDKDKRWSQCTSPNIDRQKKCTVHGKQYNIGEDYNICLNNTAQHCVCGNTSSCDPAIEYTTLKGSCIFPSTIYGKVTCGCIQSTTEDKAWCSLTDNYDRDKSWAYCKVVRIINGCYIDGIAYKTGEHYYTCTENKRKICECGKNNCTEAPDIQTPNGQCSFPFMYKSKQQCDCLEYKGRKWCATTPKYDGKNWGYCN